MFCVLSHSEEIQKSTQWKGSGDLFQHIKERGGKKGVAGQQEANDWFTITLFLMVAVESEAKGPFQVGQFCRKKRRRRERRPTLVGLVQT